MQGLIMFKRLIVVTIVSLVLCSFIILPLSTADGTMTFNTIKSYVQGATGSDTYLTAYAISGIRNKLFFAFDFSNFPANVQPDFGVFYIRSYAILDACYVEAFYFNSADWVQTNEVSNDTVLLSTGASNFVAEGDELYAFTSKDFVDAVKQACVNRGELTVVLRAKSNLYGDSTVVFNSDATLDVAYSTVSSNSPTPTPSVPEFSSIAVIPLLAIGVLITVIAYKSRK
jgi:hypothetical protein